MTLENTSADAGESTLSMISELRSSEPEVAAEPSGESAPALDTETQQTSSDKPSPETVEPAEPTEDDSEARRNALLREIAIDPSRTQQYVQQQYYQPQPQQYQQQQQINNDPILPFDEFSFDSNNPQHVQALLDARLQEVGGPLFEKLERITSRFEQEEEAKQVEQFQQIVNHANQKTVEFLDTYVPGFGAIAGKLGKQEALTPLEKAVFNEAVQAENQLFAYYEAQGYTDVRYNVQARAQIAQQIGPALQKYAKEIGLVAQPNKPKLTPEQQKVMKQEMYVESSNAVPASTQGSFEKALEKGDSLSMIRALRAK